MRYKIIIQYDGSYFSGWQIQNDKITVQGLLENILQKISKTSKRIIVHGAGRTDTGVHAFGQVAHVDLKLDLGVQEIQNALNGNLPKYCRIDSVKKVDTDFHARFKAINREYIYQCYTGKSFLYSNQSWILPKLDLIFLNNLAKQLIGDLDFLSFSKYRNDNKHTNCKVFSSYWKKNKGMFTFHINANRYLHHMVRYIVGSMIGVYQQRMTKLDFKLLLENPRKNVKIFKAPSQGLILKNVNYD